MIVEFDTALAKIQGFESDYMSLTPDETIVFEQSRKSNWLLHNFIKGTVRARDWTANIEGNALSVTVKSDKDDSLIA